MRVIRASEQKRMPWKNGGGVTNELLVSSDVPGMPGRFIYRVSIADVASDGPFSRFEGYNRHIMLIDGAGMTLDCGAHGRIDLERYQQKTFSGEWDVTASLTDGPVRDFNLIVDRDYAAAWLRARDVEDKTVFGFQGTAIVHVLEGELEEAARGDTIIAVDEELTIHGTAKLALMNIVISEKHRT